VPRKKNFVLARISPSRKVLPDMPACHVWFIAELGM
jgi:hypothetical protein